MLIVFSLLDFNYRDHIAEFDSVDSHCTAGKPHTHTVDSLPVSSYCIRLLSVCFGD